MPDARSRADNSRGLTASDCGSCRWPYKTAGRRPCRRNLRAPPLPPAVRLSTSRTCASMMIPPARLGTRLAATRGSRLRKGPGSTHPQGRQCRFRAPFIVGGRVPGAAEPAPRARSAPPPGPARKPANTLRQTGSTRSLRGGSDGWPPRAAAPPTPPPACRWRGPGRRPEYSPSPRSGRYRSVRCVRPPAR